MNSVTFDDAVYAAAVLGQTSIAEVRLRMQLTLADLHKQAIKVSRFVDHGIRRRPYIRIGLYRSGPGLAPFARPVLAQHRRGRWTMTEFQ